MASRATGGFRSDILAAATISFGRELTRGSNSGTNFCYSPETRYAAVRVCRSKRAKKICFPYAVAARADARPIRLRRIRTPLRSSSVLRRCPSILAALATYLGLGRSEYILWGRQSRERNLLPWPTTGLPKDAVEGDWRDAPLSTQAWPLTITYEREPDRRGHG